MLVLSKCMHYAGLLFSKTSNGLREIIYYEVKYSFNIKTGLEINSSQDYRKIYYYNLSMIRLESKGI